MDNRMREKKFRAWDSKRNKMIYKFDDYDFRMHTNDGDDYFIVCSYEDEKTDYYELQLLEYTGLKDKNSKEIYEGDIVKIPNDYDTYGQMAGEKREVIFSDGGFRLKPKWNKNARGQWLEDVKDFTIIGNIYENPELTKE